MIQIGEYEVTVIDITIIFFSLVALKKLVGMMLKEKIQKPKKYEIDAIPQTNLTISQVKNLRREEKRCLVIVNEKIYDLSGSRDLYESNRDVFEASEGCGDEWASIYLPDLQMALMYPFHVAQPPLNWSEHMWVTDVSPPKESFITTICEHRQAQSEAQELLRHLAENVAVIEREAPAPAPADHIIGSGTSTSSNPPTANTSVVQN